jgi:DNA-binding LacI/PurR family transcriptional regulator/DNA-binding transcriptional regulator YhcF (GntR family)
MELSKILEKIELQKSPGKSSPLYKQIVDQLRANINERKILPGEHLPPIPQLVTSWGVGYSTVHAAMRKLEKDGFLSCKTKWGKGPVILEQTPGAGLYQVMFIRWINSTQFLDIEDGIRRYSEQYNKKDNGIVLNIVECDPYVSNPDFVWKRRIAALRHAIDSADGLLIYPWAFREFKHLIEEIINNGKSVVFIDRNIHGIETSSVSCDHFRGAYMATKHLIETHGVPVYYFGDMPLNPSSCVNRLNGYLEAMREYGYHQYCKTHIFKLAHGETYYPPKDDNNDHNVTDGLEIRSEAKTFLKHVKKSSEKKISVFCLNDHNALAIYYAAEEMGLHIGRDIFIAGFGDKPYCANLPVPLTSVAQFNNETGFKAAQLLHKTLLGQHSEFIHLIHPVELKIRKSSTG